MTDPREALDALPRLGWVQAPSPLTLLPELARAVGLPWLGVKRDDLLPALHGGTKVRKLDHLLATAPFRDAPAWASPGAIGSGHLVALTAAAEKLDRRLQAFTFWEPLSAGVLENLAFTASGPAELHFHRSRVTLALSAPRVLLGGTHAGTLVIPPGGTLPAALPGLVRAGLELAAQLSASSLPAPAKLYVAFGTGGTAAGLAVGLGLAGLRTTVHAVRTVERLLAPRRTLRRHVRELLSLLRANGVSTAGWTPAPLVVDDSQLGAGYGAPTRASLAACELLAGEGLTLEAVYGGKAMAALLADARRARGPVLFWQTARRGPLPHAPDWRERLPAELSRRLLDATLDHHPGRRRVLVGAGVTALTALATGRLTGYAPLPDWQGRVLSAREAQILAAAAEALLVRLPDGPTPLAIAANVDRFLVPMPPMMQLEIHALLQLVEHATTPLGLRLSRLTELPVPAREAFLLSLQARGGLLAVAVRGLRDLCLLGLWQEPATWAAISYAGPWVQEGAQPLPAQAAYEALRAPAGATPRGSAR